MLLCAVNLICCTIVEFVVHASLAVDVVVGIGDGEGDCDGTLNAMDNGRGVGTGIGDGNGNGLFVWYGLCSYWCWRLLL